MATAARKTTKPAVTATSFNPSDSAIKATATPKGRVVASKIVKPAAAPAKKQAAKKPVVTTGKKPTAAQREKKIDEVVNKVVKAVTPKKGYAAVLEGRKTKDAKALDKIVKQKKVAKANTVTFRGFVIPVGRKSGDSEDGIPTISVKNVNETVKLFEKLPKGCTWLADTSAATKDTLNLYNKSGAYIAEVRITK